MKRLYIIIIVLFLAIQSSQIYVLAMETGFVTEELSEEDKNRFLSNVNITLLNSEPQKREIECFDVNEEELIAIGTEEGEKKYISIYNSQGVFQYGYTFHSSGSFGLEWDKNNIIIYWVRSDMAVCVDSAGEIIDISKIQNSIDNNHYWRNSVFSRERDVESNRYVMEKGDGFLDIITPSYTQLLRVNEENETRVIYDVEMSYLLEVLIILIGVVLFVGIAICGMIFQFKKLNPKNTSELSESVRHENVS